LDFVVYGKPVQQGSVKGWGGGHFAHSNSHELKPWRADVSSAAVDAIRACSQGDDYPAGDVEPAFPLSGPIAVVCEFTIKKPASAPKRRVTWPATRPDLDKYLRGVLDALSAAGVYRDDGQVVNIQTSKTFPDQDRWSLSTPGVRVLVYRIVWETEGEG
jgi:crossover junction endodeoxyribonuclease RusA